MTEIGVELSDQIEEKPTNPPDQEIETKPELWLDRYGDLLFRDAMVRLGDRAAASDAVQETLLAALRAVRVDPLVALRSD